MRFEPLWVEGPMLGVLDTKCSFRKFEKCWLIWSSHVYIKQKSGEKMFFFLHCTFQVLIFIELLQFRLLLSTFAF